MNTIRLLVIVCIVGSNIFSAAAQQKNTLAGQVKDSIIRLYNRNDFKAVYQLADTAFSNHITEQQLVRFLRNNRNSGNVISDSILSEVNGKYSYRLACESRDIKMSLQVTPAGKFTDFGFSNMPLVLLEMPAHVSTSNPLQTRLDLAVDSAAREYFRYPASCALSVGIIKNGVLHSYHYGEIKKGTGLLPDNQTVYEIGSVTKTFTATILARAVLQKKVLLSDDIRKWLPGEYANLSFNGLPVTLQDLANHTSGLPELPDDIGSQPAFNPLMPELNYNTAAFYAALRKVSLDTVPGYKFRYSNWGYALLGHILEKIYGLPYDSLLKKYITQFFAMDDTWYTLTPSLQQKMAVPNSDNGRSNIYQQEGMFGPAGYIHSTLPDMLVWLGQQISGTDPAVRLTQQPTVNDVGLGWGVAKRDGYHDIQHNGSTMGFNAHISAFPELNSGCVILVNTRGNIGGLVVRIQRIARRKDL